MLLRSVSQFISLIKKNKTTKTPSFKSQIKQILGFHPRKISLYKNAFLHVSIKKNVEDNNERLEFLGDTVLDLIIAEYLFKKYPFKNEGFLSEMKSKIVNRQNLNNIGHKLNLKILLKSNSTISSINNNLIGNTLEALIGAIYLDKGFNKTHNWVVEKIILPHIIFQEIENIEANVKNKLFQWATKNNKTIEFKIIDNQRIDNKKSVFEIAILIDGQQYGAAKAFTKKEAEQLATQQTLSMIAKHTSL